MPIQTRYNTCGPYWVNTEWTEEFANVMAATAIARGGVPLTFEEKEVEWIKWQRGNGGGTGNVDIKFVLVRVGNPPALSLNTEEDYVIYNVPNGTNFTIPALIGYKVGNLRIGGQPIDPVQDGGYGHEIDTAYFDFPFALYDQNVTFTATKTITNTPDPGATVEFNSQDFAVSDFA